jgi:hypothetical protein
MSIGAAVQPCQEIPYLCASIQEFDDPKHRPETRFQTLRTPMKKRCPGSVFGSMQLQKKELSA